MEISLHKGKLVLTDFQGKTYFGSWLTRQKSYAACEWIFECVVAELCPAPTLLSGAVMTELVSPEQQNQVPDQKKCTLSLLVHMYTPIMDL